MADPKLSIQHFRSNNLTDIAIQRRINLPHQLVAVQLFAAKHASNFALVKGAEA